MKDAVNGLEIDDDLNSKKPIKSEIISNPKPKKNTINILEFTISEFINISIFFGNRFSMKI